MSSEEKVKCPWCGLMLAGMWPCLGSDDVKTCILALAAGAKPKLRLSHAGK